VDAFDLEFHELVTALAEGFCGADAFFFHEVLDLAAQAAVADADETPRLHEADAWGLVGGFQ